jgi:hypothetical protein
LPIARKIQVPQAIHPENNIYCGQTTAEKGFGKPENRGILFRVYTGAAS